VSIIDISVHCHFHQIYPNRRTITLSQNGWVCIPRNRTTTTSQDEHITQNIFIKLYWLKKLSSDMSR